MILSLLGMGLAGLAFQEIIFIKSYQRLSLSLPVAKAALKTVFYLREDDITPSFDTYDELTKEREQVLCSSNSFKYYFVDKVNSAGALEIIDESSLINLNTATVEVLKKLPGLDEDLADRIVNSGLRPFNSINEVLMVEDMTKEKFLLFKDLVTVYGNGKININTASKAVLIALGLEDDLISAIMRFRREHKIRSTDPDMPEDLGYGFSSTDKILNDLRDFASLGLREEQDILSLLSVFDVKSDYLRFNVIPVFGSKEGLHYSIVISPKTKRIISWSEK